MPAVGVGIGIVERQRAAGSCSPLGAYVVAGSHDRGLDLSAARDRRIDQDRGTLGREVDVGLGHAIGLAQEALDAIDA